MLPLMVKQPSFWCRSSLFYLLKSFFVYSSGQSPTVRFDYYQTVTVCIKGSHVSHATVPGRNCLSYWSLLIRNQCLFGFSLNFVVSSFDHFKFKSWFHLSCSMRSTTFTVSTSIHYCGMWGTRDHKSWGLRGTGVFYLFRTNICPHSNEFAKWLQANLTPRFFKKQTWRIIGISLKCAKI